jgi:hypothetical protein
MDASSPLSPDPINWGSSASEVILTAQLAHSLYMGGIDATFFHYDFSDLDLIPLSTSNTDHAAIQPGLAHGLWYALRRLARIILCAANHYTPGQSTGDLPKVIPNAALAQIGLPSPAILAVEQYPDQNPLLFVQNRTFQFVLLRTLQAVGQSAVRWIASAIQRSGTHEEYSAWNWACATQVKFPYPLDFDLFQGSVQRELERIKLATVLDETLGDQHSPPCQELIVHPFASLSRPHNESRAVSELRDFLCSLSRSIPPPSPFAASNGPPTPSGGIDVAQLAALLERLRLTDFQEVDTNTFE